MVENKLDRAYFFWKRFLLAHISVNILLKMLFLTFNNTNIRFTNRKLTWRSYTNTKILLITKWVELIDKKKFVKMALKKDLKTFVIYVVALEASIARITN